MKKGEKSFFQIAVAIEKHPLVLDVGSPAGETAIKCLADRRMMPLHVPA